MSSMARVHQHVKRLLMVAALTVIVNTLLFGGLPNLLPQSVTPSGEEDVQVVDFLEDVIERQVEQTPRETKKAPPELLREVPQKTVQDRTFREPAPLQMEMPAFDLAVVPDMARDVPVARPAPSAPSIVPKGYYGLKEVDQAPLATFKTRPPYPYRARRLNINGEVDVRFLVDTSGRVGRISILRADPPDLFEKSVRKALSSWRFSPGQVDGRAVNTWVTTTIEFRINGE